MKTTAEQQTHQLPLVTVITAFYNKERFLEETIESVLDQEYEHYELILIDDGSSDGSTALAKKYADAYSGRIIYTEHKDHINRGLSASRNHGISLAKGSLIALLDADDVWLPSKLTVQVSTMQANPEAQMLCEASEYWYDSLETGSKNHILQIGHEHDRVFFPSELVKALYPLSDGSAPCLSGIVIRQEALARHSGFEEHFTGMYQMYEDQGFLHKIYLNEPVYISSQCHNRYRQRVESLVKKIRHDGHYEKVRKYFLEWLESYVEEHHLGDLEVQLLIIKALEPYRRPYRHLINKTGNRISKAIKKRMSSR